MSDREQLPGRTAAPMKQQNLARATELAVDALTDQSHSQLCWLGGEPMGRRWRLAVLGQPLEADVTSGDVVTLDGKAVGPPWRLLVLHYLAVRAQPVPLPPAVTFADLGTARSYAGVYHGRVIARLCATAGRNADRLRAAADSLAAAPVAEGDAAFDFHVFPRITLRLVWHAPDDEFPATATLLLPENIEEFFPSEDVVVLSESLVARLGGKPF